MQRMGEMHLEIKHLNQERDKGIGVQFVIHLMAAQVWFLMLCASEWQWDWMNCVRGEHNQSEDLPLVAPLNKTSPSSALPTQQSPGRTKNRFTSSFTFPLASLPFFIIASLSPPPLVKPTGIILWTKKEYILRPLVNILACSYFH